MSRYNSSYASTNLEVLALPMTLTLEVEEDDVDPYVPAHFSGRLMEGDIGLAGKTVTLYRHLGTGWYSIGMTFVTNAQGYYEGAIEFVQGGNYELRAQYSTAISNTVLLIVNQTLETVLTAAIEDSSVYLGEDFVVYGKLVGSDGIPLSGMTINITISGILGLKATVHTDSSGEYSAELNTIDAGITAAGSYIIQVQFPGYTTDTTT
jgi:hypothetical protein